MLISAGNGQHPGIHHHQRASTWRWARQPRAHDLAGPQKGDPGYYDLMINHAVRISNSGEYVHALDNVWAQGRQNVSHGCINSRPDQAQWFYNQVQRGDLVIITGTTRDLEWNNGWGYWQLSWPRWLAGSALRQDGADYPFHRLLTETVAFESASCITVEAWQ